MKIRLVALLALLATPAAAHVTAQPDEAPAGAYMQIAFRVGHGCDGSATQALRVRIPPGVAAVRPQFKIGWPVTLVRSKDDPKIIQEVVWQGGPLPDFQYEDFGLLMELPDKAGSTLWFPAIQECVKGQSNWTETPAPGRSSDQLDKLAPFVKLTNRR